MEPVLRFQTLWCRDKLLYILIGRERNVAMLAHKMKTTQMIRQKY